jgi:hypothetical protein
MRLLLARGRRRIDSKGMQNEVAFVELTGAVSAAQENYSSE